MRPGIGSPIQILLEYRRPVLRDNLLQLHVLATAVAYGDPSARSLHVAHPVYVLPEHGNEIALTIDHDHEERRTEDPARLPPRHLQRDHVVRRHPEPVHHRPTPIDEPRQPVGTPPTIEPSRQAHPSSLLARRQHPSQFVRCTCTPYIYEHTCTVYNCQQMAGMDRRV